MELVLVLISGVMGLIGAIVGARFTLFMQEKKERVQWREGYKRERILYVEFSVIKKQGPNNYYVPGYGRFLEYSDETYEKAKEDLGGRIAYLCSDATATDGKEVEIIPYVIVPL